MMGGKHDHGHGHHHGHAHAAPHPGRAFAIGAAVNLGFVVVEAVYGFLSGSMALVADAGHNLSDVLGLVIAGGATLLARRRPGGRFTYGLRRAPILAALVNALLLLIAIGAIAAEAIRRLFEPAPVAGGTVVVVAALGIAVNLATALLFLRGRAHDINVRGAFLHMAADAAVSAGVVLAGFAIMLTGQAWIDPLTSLAIAALVAWASWGLLRDAVSMSLDAVPAGIAVDEVRAFLRAVPGVEAVHDLHIWPLSTTETALTAHLVMPGGAPGDAFLHDLAHRLDARFGILHATVQVETGVEGECALAPAHVV